MRFLWPETLWLLLAVPALICAYILLLKRKKRTALRYPSLSLIRQAMSPGDRYRRHIPPLLFLLSLIAEIVAIARPTVPITLPSLRQTVILVIDVSLSMAATDVDPNRITAAQAAAKAFIEERPPNTLVGLVAFGGAAELVQPPTLDREALLAAINRFQLQRSTATGSALYVALAALLPDAGIDLESLIFKGGFSRYSEGGSRLGALPQPKKQEPKAVAPGSYTSGAIILMSDGRRTTGPDPIDAAHLAADHGVRVFTVGFGKAEGALISADGWSVYVRLDEETLKRVAEITRGAYFHAGTAEDLRKVYQDLNARLVLEKKDSEVSFAWTAGAAALLLASLLLSLLWFNRVL